MVLRVKLEVVPFGDEDKAYEIGRLDIFNKGLHPGSTDWFDYGIIDLTPHKEGLLDTTVQHVRKHGAWKLVHAVTGQYSIEGP